jgi:hypothetical protein
MPEMAKCSLSGKIVAYFFILLFLAGVAWLCIEKPIALAIVSAIIIYLVIATVKENSRLRLMTSERAEDSICTFARAFDKRIIDPWTIRAAYDELQEYFGSLERPFPIRASDRFKEDLKMDGDDLCDLLFSIAKRSKHDITSLDDNLQISTVGELVACISNLPKTSEAEQDAT